MSAAVMLAVMVAGCSSSGSSGDSSGAGSGSTTTAAGNPSSGSGTVSVDLVITGDRPATIKGTKGRCSIPSNAAMISGYDFSGTDYPSLGAGGDFSVAGPQQAAAGIALASSMKAIINGGGFLDTGGAGITISANKKKVTLDADLGGGTAGTATNPGAPLHDHVTGTITCG